MAKIAPLDKLFITLTQNGSSRFLGEITGVSSWCDIINYMRNTIPGLCGLATVSVRNCSEGWSTSQSVLLK